MSLAEKMIELRKQNGLSQQDLADRLGVSRQAISRWETGAVQPLADSVKSLAQVFQVSTDYLLNDDLDAPTPLHPPEAPEVAPGSGGSGSCGRHCRNGALSQMERRPTSIHL